jgi:hypothetical protein
MMRLALAATLIAGCASSAPLAPQVNERAAARLADFDDTGEAVACLRRGFETIIAVDAARLLVRANFDDYYLNAPKPECAEALWSGARLAHESDGPGACEGDIVRIVDSRNGMPLGQCALGVFHRLTPKSAE